MGMNEQIAQSAVQDMKDIWGGNLPSWDEYKKAYNSGRVRANKTVAAQAINLRGIPKAYFILYDVITLWTGFLIFPATLIAYFFMDFSAWWILGAFFAAWFLVKLSREGHCEGMKCGAERNEQLYQILINNGAFLFEPEIR
ncbi:MAG: hypothetical protein M0036_02850 [Desulfobacteraceae bacterium]|nr:hypothetical protein [Desulfobacteraceae bacterium]